MTSDYGTMLLNAKEEYDRDAAMVSHVFSFGVTLSSKDGYMWCALLGANPKEGVAFYESTPMGAIKKMSVFLYSGKE